MFYFLFCQITENCSTVKRAHQTWRLQLDLDSKVHCLKHHLVVCKEDCLSVCLQRARSSLRIIARYIDDLRAIHYEELKQGRPCQLETSSSEEEKTDEEEEEEEEKDEEKEEKGDK